MSIYSDPNIDETSEQIQKSNNGPENCCYHFCEENKICATCDSTINLQLEKELENDIARKCDTQPSTNTSKPENPCVLPMYIENTTTTSSSGTKLLSFNIYNYNYYTNLSMIILWSILFNVAAWNTILLYQLAGS